MFWVKEQGAEEKRREGKTGLGTFSTRNIKNVKKSSLIVPQIIVVHTNTTKIDEIRQNCNIFKFF